MIRTDIYERIEHERREQHAKWGGTHEWGVGDCSSPDVAITVKAAVLAEECGEVSRAVLDAITESGTIRDDAQVVSLRVRKRYGQPGVRITLGEEL